MSSVRIDTRKLDQIIAQQPGKVQRWGDGFAESIVTHIKLSFGTSPPGEVYTRGGVTHVASQPNYPPNVDTGTLRASMRQERVGQFVWRVMDGTEYGIQLEYGREDMSPRPFVVPAFVDAQRRLADDIKRNLFGDLQ